MGQELKTIPYWDEDEDDLPETIPPTTTVHVPVAGKRDPYFIIDEMDQFNFPSCFAERL